MISRLTPSRSADSQSVCMLVLLNSGSELDKTGGGRCAGCCAAPGGSCWTLVVLRPSQSERGYLTFPTARWRWVRVRCLFPRFLSTRYMHVHPLHACPSTACMSTHEDGGGPQLRAQRDVLSHMLRENHATPSHAGSSEQRGGLRRNR